MLRAGAAVPLDAVVVSSFGDRDGDSRCLAVAPAVQSIPAASRYDLPTRAGRSWAMAVGWL